jgi:hypothetical protein
LSLANPAAVPSPVSLADLAAGAAPLLVAATASELAAYLRQPGAKAASLAVVMMVFVVVAEQVGDEPLQRVLEARRNPSPLFLGPLDPVHDPVEGMHQPPVALVLPVGPSGYRQGQEEGDGQHRGEKVQPAFWLPGARGHLLTSDPRCGKQVP